MLGGYVQEGDRETQGIVLVYGNSTQHGPGVHTPALSTRSYTISYTRLYHLVFYCAIPCYAVPCYGIRLYEVVLLMV